MTVKSPRVPWHQYFMSVAVQVSSRSTCDRKRVGAVLVQDQTIISTGYNGSVRGSVHCDEAGHIIADNHCVRTIHAEVNALLQAAKHGVRVDGATLYSTHSPCWTCFKLLANAGVKRVIFDEDSGDVPYGALELGISIDTMSRLT